MSSHAAAACALAALGCGVAAAILSATHPVAPLAAALLALLAALAEARRPGLWLWLLPACLPWLGFAPWTGWIVVDEFDLLLLSLCAGAYARLALVAADADRQAAAGAAVPGPASGLLAALPWPVWLWSALTGVALWRGWTGAGGGWDPFASYVEAGNSLRVAKSLVWVWLCVPLAWLSCRQGLATAWRRWLIGTCCGLAVTGLAVLWERFAHAGFLDFESVYRASGLFWEMHVGGGVIDAYLALGLPFAALAAIRANGFGRRLSALALVVLTLHAIVATVSRLAMAGGLIGALVWLALLRQPQDIEGKRRPRWPKAVGLAALMAVGGLAALLMSQESFLGNRLRATEQVWLERVDHWQRGLGLAQSTAERWFGIGLGRFVARYSQAVDGGGLPGAARVAEGLGPEGAGAPFLMLRGPDEDDEDKSGLFALTQRVHPTPGVRFLAGGSYRASDDAALLVQVCERHLLYPRQCQGVVVALAGGDGAWRSFSLPLEGERFGPAPSWAPRLGMYAVSVLTPGVQVDLAGLSLQDGPGSQRLINGDFVQGLARWFPAARFYFRPWHADALWLEAWVERGVLGLGAGAALVAVVAMRLARLRRRHADLRACLAGALMGLLVVAMGASLLDAPRIAFLAQFLLFFAVLASRCEREEGQVGASPGLTRSPSV